jgi:hypothetical protein
MFDSRVLRKLFGTKRNEVTGDWRILYNEELNNSNSTYHANCKKMNVVYKYVR